MIKINTYQVAAGESRVIPISLIALSTKRVAVVCLQSNARNVDAKQTLFPAAHIATMDSWQDAIGVQYSTLQYDVFRVDCTLPRAMLECDLSSIPITVSLWQDNVIVARCGTVRQGPGKINFNVRCGTSFRTAGIKPYLVKIELYGVTIHTGIILLYTHKSQLANVDMSACVEALRACLLPRN